MAMLAVSVLSSSWAVLTVLAAILIAVGWWALSRPVGPPPPRPNRRISVDEIMDRHAGRL